jgi:hypothetical protein
VGVAAEEVVDSFVAQLEAQTDLHARLRKQGGGLRVHQGGLAVHVGHLGEAALHQGQAAVLPTLHQLLRQRQGQRVLRKGAGGVAVDVARERVQHQHLCRAPLWRGAPGKQFASRSRLQHRAEAAADGFGQGREFGSVLLVGQFGEPEVEDGLRLHG